MCKSLISPGLNVVFLFIKKKVTRTVGEPEEDEEYGEDALEDDGAE
jgi:hypothetical protein